MNRKEQKEFFLLIGNFRWKNIFMKTWRKIPTNQITEQIEVFYQKHEVNLHMMKIYVVVSKNKTNLKLIKNFFKNL